MAQLALALLLAQTSARRPSLQGSAPAKPLGAPGPPRGALAGAPPPRGGAPPAPAPARASAASSALSVVFGAGLVLGSLGLKLPQISKLLRTRSTAGLSLLGCYGEVPMCLSFAIYHARLGYPLDSYAENLLLAAQNLAIIGIYWALSPPPLAHMLGVATAGIALHAGLWLLPTRWQPLVAQAQPAVMLWGYAPQIALNARLGCTGSLSAVTTAMRFAGCALRLVTTVTRIGLDPYLLGAYGLAALCTGTMLAQIATLPAACTVH